MGLNKRILRELKKNFLRYFALFLLITLSIYLITSLVGAAETIITGNAKEAKRNLVEDGEFTVFVPLSKKNISDLKSKGVIVEEMFYLDFKTKNNSTIRVFKNRENVNLAKADKGSIPKGKQDILLEKHYTSSHLLSIGDEFEISNTKFKVSGIGSSPDYDNVIEKITDVGANSEKFGTAFVTSEAYDILNKSGKASSSEEYSYSYRLSGAMTSEALKDYLSKLEYDIDNLTMFLESKDNPRIGAAADDVLIKKVTGTYAGIIVLVLLAYVISVFVVYSIDEESKVIGALYALGVSKKALILHYLMLPIIISFLGGVIGTLIGFSNMGISMQTLDTSRYYSFPELTNVYPPYLIVYGFFAPPFIAVIVNLLVINKKLTKSPLKLLRKDRGDNKISKVKLFNMGFINCFRIRQLLREKRSGFAIGAGMFISLLILMLGLNCYASISNMKENNEKDIKFQYMYTLKYPDKVVPNKGEACYIQSLNRENLGYDIEVSVLGIDDNNPYLDFTPTKGKRNLTISTSVATKFKLSVGEKVIFTDKVNDKDYSFTVDKIVPYSVGLYAFMDINSMRDVFDKEKDYYNALLSSESLSIDQGRIYATTSKDDLLEFSNIFMNMMKPMIVTLIAVSIIIFIVVLYLMMKVIIDRSKFNISLMKIFGFNNREIRKLYLDSNFFIVVVSSVVCIPLSKLIINNIWPILISNVAMGFNSKFPMWMYLSLFALVIASYIVINFLLTYKLKKVTTSEVLKSQE